MSKKGNLIGSWAFLIGVVLALVVGLLGTTNTTWLYLLIAAGLIIGLLNIADKETNPFLISGLALIIAATFGQSITQQIPMLNNVLQALLAIFVPATVIVAIKNVFTLARN